MFKLIVTFKRRKGLTLDEFIHHYEKVHLPLCQRILPPLQLHRRNYVLTDHPFYAQVGDNRGDAALEPPFDVITEAMYDDEAAARASMDALFDESRGPLIFQDETNFVEPGSINFYVVKVHQTAVPWGS